MGSPLQIFSLVLTHLALVLLVVKGRRAERLAAIPLVIGQWGTPLVDELTIGRFRWAVALISVGIFVALVRLALRHDRWWLLLAAGAQALSLATHVVTLFGSPALTWSVVSTRITIWTEIMLLALIGVWEARAASYAKAPLPRDADRAGRPQGIRN